MSITPRTRTQLASEGLEEIIPLLEEAGLHRLVNIHNDGITEDDLRDAGIVKVFHIKRLMRLSREASMEGSVVTSGESAGRGRASAEAAELEFDTKTRFIAFRESVTPRLVDRVGFEGDSHIEYFDFCRTQDELLPTEEEQMVHKELTPLLCTIGVGGQGKTELCEEILRTLQRQKAAGVCAVHVSFNQGFDWMTSSSYRDWDKGGVFRGLWARIGSVMRIPNWKRFEPHDISDIYDALHTLTKRRYPDAEVTEVHLLIDETMKISDAGERRKLLDGIVGAIQESMNTYSELKRRNYALVTSLRAQPMKAGMAVSDSKRILRYLPLGTPTLAKRKIALALLLYVSFTVLERALKVTIPDLNHISKSILEKHSGVGSPTGSPLGAKRIDVVGSVLEALGSHLDTSSKSVTQVKRFVYELFHSVNLSVCHAVYASGTWRSIEQLFLRKDSPYFSDFIGTKTVETEAGISTELIVASQIPSILSYCNPLHDASENTAEHVKACTRQLMKLTAGWMSLDGGPVEGPFVVNENEVTAQLESGTMWIYRRDKEDTLKTIPFVSLTFLQDARDQRLLTNVEKAFHSTFKLLSKELMCPTVADLPRAFERAVILSIGLKLLAQNSGDAKSPMVSATLEELLPFALFEKEETKQLCLRQIVDGTDLHLKTLPLNKATTRHSSGVGSATTHELMSMPYDPHLLGVAEGTTNAKAIEGVTWFCSEEETVLCVYSMKLRKGSHAISAFRSAYAVLEEYHRDEASPPLPSRVCILVACPEEMRPDQFPTAKDFCRSVGGDIVAPVKVEQILVGYKALGELLGPFGASFLRMLVDEKAATSMSPGGQQSTTGKNRDH